MGSHPLELHCRWFGHNWNVRGPFERLGIWMWADVVCVYCWVGSRVRRINDDIPGVYWREPGWELGDWDLINWVENGALEITRIEVKGIL